MTEVAIKEELIGKISSIKDKKRLKAIKNFIEKDSLVVCDDGSIKLSSEMKDLLEKSSNQIKNGKFKTHKQVMAETKQWLNERR